MNKRLEPIIRNKQPHRMILLAAAALLLPGGCEEEQQPAGDAPPKTGRPVVYTTFYPTTYFVERIAGDRVDVVCPCPADADPAYWMPDDETIKAYQAADLVVVNGASFEKWLEAVSLPESRLVNTAKPLAGELITLPDAVSHSHGPGGAHAHAGIDGHTWLDPVSARTQAGQIRDALIAAFPAEKEAFRQGYQALAADLDALDLRLKALTAKMPDQVLLNSHPAYNYLARRYGWKVKYFHLDPEQMPDDGTMAEVGAFLAEQPAKLMLWEAQPAEKIAKRFQEQFGVESVVYSPGESLAAEQRRAGMDFLALLNQNVTRLAEALGQSG